MIKNKIYIFDVDGTLTPSRKVMDPKFQTYFRDWGQKHKFYIVSGSDLPKIQEQMAGLDSLAQGIFPCCGNEFWYEGDLLYQNKFTPPNTLLTYLGDLVRNSDYPVKSGNHLEDRGSMLNFSTVGRNCSTAQRHDYFEYDKMVGERDEIANYIKEQFPKLDAVIGGQISIDIYPKGFDKSQVLEHIKLWERDRKDVFKYFFIGDRTLPGGNDYPLATLMEETINCEVHQVDDYRETRKLITKL